MKSRRAVAILPAMVIVPVLAVSGHRAARDHVRYETGLEPRSVACLSCHVVARGGTLQDRLFEPRYRSPLALALTHDGRRLYATASDGAALLEIDTASRQLQREIALPAAPGSIVIAPDDSQAYVTLRASGEVAVLDLRTGKVATHAVGDEPIGLALSADGHDLVVANSSGDDVSILDRARAAETGRLAAGASPWAVASIPGTTHVLVTSLLSFARGPNHMPESELTEIDTARRTVVRRIKVENAHMLEGIAVAPEGDLALFTLVRPKNLIPAIDVARGWMMTTGLGVLDVASGRVVQLPLDEPGRCFADPCDVVLTPDGRTAFVSHAGVDTVSAIDVGAVRTLVGALDADRAAAIANDLGTARRIVRSRIAVGANPKGMAAAPDGRVVYVAERLSDHIAVIDTASLAVTARIDVSTTTHETVLRRGERLFNSASHTFQWQFSCRSCHPSNRVDRLQYDLEPDGLGKNILDNRSLLGIDGTDPFKWNGKNTSMYMQCGMRFAKFLTRVEPFAPDDLNALVAFLRSLENRPSPHRTADGELTPAQAHGKVLYVRAARADGRPLTEKERCAACHPEPRYTDQRRSDVGTQAATDSVKEFDTPQLDNVSDTAPYLHDGRATTLEQIWTRFNPDDRHGVTSDFTKQDLNDLIEYLKVL